MKDLKAEINARIAEGAIPTKGAILRRVHISKERDERGRASVVCTLTKSILGPVKINADYLVRLGHKIAKTKTAIESAGDQAPEELTKSLTEMEAKADLPIGTWIIDETDTLFSSNFEMLGILNNNPKYASVTKILRNDDELFEDTFRFSQVNILTEKVTKNMPYVGLFSDNVHTVPNDSAYSCFTKLSLHEEGEELLDEIKREIRAQRIAGAISSPSPKTSLSQRSDDDD